MRQREEEKKGREEEGREGEKEGGSSLLELNGVHLLVLLLSLGHGIDPLMYLNLYRLSKHRVLDSCEII